MRGSWGGEGNVALNTENREGEGVGACRYTGEWKGWIKEFCRSLGQAQRIKTGRAPHLA